MENQKKILAALLALMNIALISYLCFYIWKSFYSQNVAMQPSIVIKKTEPKSLGQEIYEEIKNPMQDIPQTNPYSAKTNPFEEAKTNPFRDIYKNPFAK